MSEFIELLPDEEYEALREKGISLIRQATKESILEWLRYDNECIMLEMLEDFVSGQSVTIVISPGVQSAALSEAQLCQTFHQESKA